MSDPHLTLRRRLRQSETFPETSTPLNEDHSPGQQDLSERHTVHHAALSLSMIGMMVELPIQQNPKYPSLTRELDRPEQGADDADGVEGGEPTMRDFPLGEAIEEGSHGGGILIRTSGGGGGGLFTFGGGRAR